MPRNGENVAGQPLHLLAGQPVASQVTLHAASKIQTEGWNSCLCTLTNYFFYEYVSGFAIRIRIQKGKSHEKWTTNIGKVNKFHVLIVFKCWMFAFEGWRDKWIAIFDQKKDKKNFQLYFFLQFWSSKPCIRIGSEYGSVSESVSGFAWNAGSGSVSTALPQTLRTVFYLKTTGVPPDTSFALKNILSRIFFLICWRLFAPAFLKSPFICEENFSFSSNSGFLFETLSS